MVTLPLRSTIFPYTTLFRSSIEIGNCSWWMSDEFEVLRPRLVIPVGRLAIAQFVPFEKLDDVVGKKFALHLDGHRFDRSEEHTSELQSQFHLVCRLLLEKKT